MIARIALAVIAACLIAGAAAAADPPRASDLEAELVCPTCATTLDQSSSPIAERMKLHIRQRIAAGDSEQEIKDALVAEFGPAVLARPLAGAAAAIVAVAVLVRGWSRRAPDEAEPPLDPELERRVDDELARFEG